MAKSGRPSKLTPEVTDKIAEMVLHGATFSDACRAADVSYDTFRAWMVQGEAATSGKFYDFYHKVTVADAECGVNMTRMIQQAAANRDWKAALEWLKRRRRADWGDNVDFTSGGEKVKAYVGWSPDSWDSLPDDEGE